MTEFVTINQIAQRASMSEKTVRRFIRRGEIPSYRPNPRGKILIRWSDFEAWIESRRVRIESDADAKEMLEILFAPESLPNRKSA